MGNQDQCPDFPSAFISVHLWLTFFPVLTASPGICHNRRRLCTLPTDGVAMATDSARTTAPRHLWQVPVFFLGVAALVAVVLLRPRLGPDTLVAAEHQLRDARKALEQTPPDP